MAKLSKRQSRRVAFVASKMALSIDQDERMVLLTELLDELGIDAEQRAERKESAERHIRYEAQQRRQRQSKPVDSKVEPDIDKMSLDELQQYNRESLAKLKRLLEERRAQRLDIEAMSDEERQAYQQHLMRSIAAKLELTPSTPDPAPIVEDAPTLALPTKRMEKAIARFDGLSDADQVDSLRTLWARR